MNNLCTHIKRILILTGVLFCTFTFGQKNKVYRAQELLNAKQADAAKLCIDSAMNVKESALMYEAHTVKAFIYFELYKKSERQKLNNPLRDSIVNALKTSNSLNPDDDYKGNNSKLLATMASNYYNIAKSILQDSLNYERASVAFEKYKFVMTLSDPGFKAGEKDKEFYLAAGSIFSELYNKDNSDDKAHEVAKVTLLKVIDMQPDEPSANFNMGLMYLNSAIRIVENMDDVPEFDKLEIIMDNYIKLAKQAEQFMLKVYQKNNQNPKSVQALYYVYRILNDEAKKEEFKNKCKELNISISDN